MIGTLTITLVLPAVLIRLRMIRLVHAMFPEGPNFSFLWGRPYYGIEFRVWREHWLWIGYTNWDDRRRGW